MEVVADHTCDDETWMFVVFTKSEMEELIDIKYKLDNFEGEHDPLELVADWLKAIEKTYIDIYTNKSDVPDRESNIHANADDGKGRQEGR